MSIGSLLFLTLVAAPHQDERDERPYPLMIGDPAPAIAVAEWVRGPEVTAFAPGRVYVVEFWATWCPPCKVAIPHLNRLAKEYAGRVEFVGVSVWERISAEKPYAVPEFVRAMGEEMTYPVAADLTRESPEPGPMARTWMAAAGQGSIPTAFVVDREGRIAWIGNPMRIDEPLASVVAGTWDRAAAAKRQLAEVRLKARTDKLTKQVSKAKRDKDFARALELIEAAVAEDRSLEASFGIDKYFLLLDAGRAADAAVYGQRLVGTVIADNAKALNVLAWTIVDPQLDRAQGDWELAARAAERAVTLLGGSDAATLDTLGLALFKSGKLERAIEVQSKAVELAKDQPALEKELRGRLAEFRAARRDP